MRTADRLLAGRLHPPLGTFDSPKWGENWKTYATDLIRALGGRCPIVVADNIAVYVEARERVGLELYPSLAPPWPEFWVEHCSSSKRERRGVLVRDVTKADRTVDGAFAGAVKDARENGYDGEIGWVLDFGIVIENEAHDVCGPVGWFVLALDPRGRCVGNRWVLATRQGPVVVDRLTGRDGRELSWDEWMFRTLQVTLQSIAFMHCRNAKVDTVSPPEKLSARHRRRHGRPLLRYQQVRLQVPRRASGGETKPAAGGEFSLHIVAGSFHHYGDCCPPASTCAKAHDRTLCESCGGHAEHGKLFGSLEGVFWVPSHIRGDPTVGAVRSDVELVVR